ncbi:hypothetical protein F5888DRAFT_1656888 [Russula emetica]|nr:hypothetical protein F5888DRAFT_1656888 [Russula emetica]
MACPCDYYNFGAPFDDSDADIILRSLPSASPGCDRTSATHFRVHRLFLIKASPEFKRLLCETIPSQYPNQDEEPGITRDNYDNLPVLCLSEDRETLHSLLTAIYPTDVAYPRSLEAMMKTHAAAKKFGMSSALTLFRTYCTSVAPVVTTENAFRAFFLAFNKGLKEEALEAARLSLSLPLTFEALDEELYNASGPALEALWRHREAGLRAIVEGVTACRTEVEDLRGWSSHDRSRCAKNVSRPRQQLSFFASKVIADFSLMNFSSFVEIMLSQGVFQCPSCKAPLRLEFRRLFSCLEAHVDDCIERIHNELLSLVDGSEEPPNLQLSCEQPKNFGPPFERGDADLIIRSCDQVDFHVHKAILGVASVAFEDMFTAPGQGRDESVVNLAEDSKTLHRLLTAIYPVDLSIPETFEESLSLIASCQKYQMDSTAAYIRSLLKERRPTLFTALNSFRAYGIASRYHLKEEALLAARLTLERRMDFHTCAEDLHYISGADLFRLWQYRTECTTVAKDCINQMIGNEDDAPSASACCSGLVDVGKYDTKELQSVPRWWHRHFLHRAANQPSPKTITDRKAFEHALKMHHTLTGCTACLSPDETRVDNTICAAVEAKLKVAIDQAML